MTLIQLILVLATIFIIASVVLFILFKPQAKVKANKKKETKRKEQKKALLENVEANAKDDVEHIFNDEFREELRNRGRLHFEKIIGENAMFLQQDLRLTTSQLNEFMKTEVTNVLKDEFAKYEESIDDAKQLAIDSIQKTQATIEQQRELMSAQLTEQLEAEKARTLNRFEIRMADVINHYVMEAIGDQIDLTEQLEFILSQMEANKEAIMRDIREGA